MVTSKDTEAGGGLSLAVKKTKPNNAGPFTKSTKIKWSRGKKDKKQPTQETSRNKNAEAAEENQEALACSSSSAVLPLSTSTPQKITAIKPKEISRHMSPETLLDTLIAADRNRMVDQVLERGVQQTAEDILTSRDATGKDDDSINSPGFSDELGEEETSVRRSGRSKKGPSRYGDPIKQSVKLISSQNDILDLYKAALGANRIKLATFEPDTKNSIETKFGLLEKHLFRRKFGSEALDINRSWNAEWRVPLQFGEEHHKKDGK